MAEWNGYSSLGAPLGPPGQAAAHSAVDTIGHGPDVAGADLPEAALTTTRRPLHRSSRLLAATLVLLGGAAVVGTVSVRLRGSPAATVAVAPGRRAPTGARGVRPGLSEILRFEEDGSDPGASNASAAPRHAASGRGSGGIAGNLTRAHIGFFKSVVFGTCLGRAHAGQDGSGDSGFVPVTVADCDYEEARTDQLWAVEAEQGFIKNLLSLGGCLDVKGSPGWRQGTPLGIGDCDMEETSETDQRWKFNEGGYIVNRLSGKCVEVRPPNASVDERTPQIQLWHCGFDDKRSHQQWEFVGLPQVAMIRGLGGGRVAGALIAEESRRQGVRSKGSSLLTFSDVVRAEDPAVLLGGSYWTAMRDTLQPFNPGWSDWQGLGKLWALLREEGPLQEAFGTAFTANLLSNMVFAGMNFVSGSERPRFEMWGDYQLQLEEFVGTDTCAPEVTREYCVWPKPAEGEEMSVVSFQDFIKENYDHHLPDHTLFEGIFTGGRIPSWEDTTGHDAAFAIMDAGMAAAHRSGIEPVTLVGRSTDARFAFDNEGIIQLFDTGFGWFKERDVAYASNGAYGIPVVEKLLQKYNEDRDVLGVLMTDSVLSAHLTYNGSCFVADLTRFEKYKPLRGYAPLGGRAYFEARDGRLVTTRLEYRNRTYTNFTDPSSDKNYAEKSTLSGWRFARAAIIASLLAKTQLLMHIKTIHLELAPALQAVTVDAFARHLRHPLRRLLEPFISRNVQATNTNLKLWFQYRAGEFGLAPLPIQAQLKLIHDETQDAPLNLADLDMERYAKDRGMLEFTDAGVVDRAHHSPFESTAKRLAKGKKHWRWRWYNRALKMQRALDKLVGCWLDEHYGGQNGQISDDPGVVAWWNSLLLHMPALRVAAQESRDWITNDLEPPGSATASTPLAQSSTEPAISTPSIPSAETSSNSAATAATSDAEPLSMGPSSAEEEDGGELEGPSPTPAPGPSTTTTRKPDDGLADSVPPEAMALWRRLLGRDLGLGPVSAGAPERLRRVAAAAGAEQQGGTGGWAAEPVVLPGGQRVPSLTKEALRNVLRTLMVWVSLIHEDVGHSAAAFVYNPIYTPAFVPEDGIGIPVAPLTLSVTAYRSFIFLERAAITGSPPEFWFDQQVCKRYMVFWHKCTVKKDDKVCFTDFQKELARLKEDASFSDCGKRGFYSCVDSVESSASS